MRILIHFRHFPVAMGRFFDWALRDLGHDVRSVGCYQGDWIPWNGGMNVGYAFPPYLETPDVEEYPINMVFSQMEDWKPDIVIQMGDTQFLGGRLMYDIPNIIVATDPHAVDYNPRLKFATHFISMQGCYLDKYDFPNKFWIPYGYSEDIHKKLDLIRTTDVACIGLQYGPRVEVMKKLESKGYKVDYGIGKVYDEYVKSYNRAKIAFVASSKDDLPARFWEGLAMGCCVVTNLVPDHFKINLMPEVDYVKYDNLDQAIDKIESVLKGNYQGYVTSGYANLKKGNHEYKDRVKELIKYVTA